MTGPIPAQTGPLLATVLLLWLSPATSRAAPPKRAPTVQEARELGQANDRLDAHIERHAWWEAERVSLDLLQRLSAFEEDDAPEMCRQRVKLARAYQGQGRWTEARDRLRADVAVLEKADKLQKYGTDPEPLLDPVDLPQALYILGSVEMQLQETGPAVRHFEQAIELLDNPKRYGGRAAPPFDSELLAMALKARGLIRAGQGDFRLAREGFTEGLKKKLHPPQPRFQAVLRQSLSVTWLVEAEEHWLTGRGAEAAEKLRHAERELAEAEKYHRSLTRPTPLDTELLESVRLARTMLDAVKARSQSTARTTPFRVSTYGLFSTLTPLETQALSLSATAMSHAETGRFPEADRALTRALDVLKMAPSNEHMAIHFQFDQALIRGAFLGRAEEGALLAEAALDRLYALTLKDLAFQSLRQQQLVLQSCESHVRLYLSLAVKAGTSPERIYPHLLRWKGTLFRLYSKERTPPEGRQQYEQLLTKANEARRIHTRCVAAAETREDDRRRTREQLERAERGLAEFLSKQPPWESNEVSPSELAARLAPGTALLDFAIYHDLSPTGRAGDADPFRSRYLVFVLRDGHSEVTMVTLPESAATVNQWILRWRELVPTARGAEESGRTLRALSVQIADAVWRPVEPLCRDSRLLVISPTGVLWAFPFAAIPEGERDFLIRRHPIAHVIAASCVPPVERRTAPRASTPYVLVNEIAYTNERDRIRWGPLVTRHLSHRLSGPDLVPLLGDRATKRAFLETLHQFGTNVCFVGHGIWSPQVKERPAFLVAPTELPNPGARAELTADPFQFRLPLAGADLTTRPSPGDPAWADAWVADDELVRAVPAGANRFEMWACSALLGSMHPTEGMLSLPRALLLGGYRCVIAPLWEVQEHTAVEGVVKRFHDRIHGGGLGEAVALQRAMYDAIDTGDEDAEPRNWAAWAVVGDASDPEPVPLPAEPAEPPSTWRSAVALVLLVTVLSGFAWHLRRRIRRRNRTPEPVSSPQQ